MRAFGVSKSSVDRSLKKLREEGPAAFFRERTTRRGGTVFTPEVLKQAQQLLDQHFSRGDVAKEFAIKPDTLRKAIYDGRLYEPSDAPQPTTTKSARDVADAQAADHMGAACTRPEERTLAAFGMSDGAPVVFEPCVDVPNGGVLCALPALLLNGLLDGCDQLLGELKGYSARSKERFVLSRP